MTDRNDIKQMIAQMMGTGPPNKWYRSDVFTTTTLEVRPNPPTP